MISFKTHAPIPTNQNPARLESDSANNLNAKQMAEVFGEGGNVGDHLNRIADPNYIDPNVAVRNTRKNELGKDDFMKLMLTQMKNQDPTTPLKSHEMAAQMAQFTSLEQLTNINKGIESLAAAKSAGGGGGGRFDALQLIGKVAGGDSAKIYRSKGEDDHVINFSLPKSAMSAEVKIKDAAGETVKTMKLSSLKKGNNQLRWNGLTEDGLKAREGEYKFSIEAKGLNGGKIAATTAFEGVVSGVKFVSGAPVLLVNGQTIRMNDVQKITDPTLQGNGKGPDSKTQDLQKNTTVGENDKKVEDENRVTPELLESKKVALNGVEEKKVEPGKGNIDDVPMSRGLINKLAKQK